MPSTDSQKQPICCVGRDKELSQLSRLLGHAPQTPSFVLVGGESGIGKSSLLHEAARQFREQGVLVLEAHCQPGLPSLNPIRELVKHTLPQLCMTRSSGLLDRAERLLEGLSGTRSLEDTCRDGSWSIDGRISLFDELSELLRDISASRVVVVILHDVDQADRATQQALAFIAAAITAPPLFAKNAFSGLVVASAIDRDCLDVGDRKSINLVHLEVEGLDEAGVRSYLSSDDVVRRVIEQTGGRAFQIEELLAGVEVRPRGGLPLSCPLDDAEEQVVKVLAVIGRPAGGETLRQLTNQPHARLVSTVASLTDKRIAFKRLVDSELRIALGRSGMQRAVYEAIEPKERTSLHAAYGRLLKTHCRATTRSVGELELEICADHLLHGNCGDEAVELALEAGAYLELTFCYERAAEIYQRALEQASGERYTEILERLSMVYESGGQLDLAISTAEELCRRRPEPAIRLRLADLHLLQGDYAAMRTVLAALQSEQSLAAPLRARVLADLSEADHLTGDAEGALASARSGIDLLTATDQGPSSTQTMILLHNRVAQIELERHAYDNAERIIKKTLELARTEGLPREEVLALTQLGQLHLRRGDLDAAGRQYQQARSLAERTGHYRRLAICLQHLGVLAERQRNYASALSHYHDAISVMKKLGHRSYLAWVALDLGKLYIDLGDVGRAGAMLDLADRLVGTDPPLSTSINIELVRGRMAQHQCRFVEAAGCFSRALDLSVGDPERACRCQLHIVDLLVEQSEFGTAIERLEALPEPCTRALMLQALVARGRVTQGTGDLTGARSNLAAALELADELGDGEARWRVRLLLGELSRQQGQNRAARRLFSEAARIEKQVRSTIPKELRELVSEQPQRLQLQHALQRLHNKPVESDESEPRVEVTSAARELSPIVGEHQRIEQMKTQIGKVARTDLMVLIQGESGTGKELVADAIHQQSQRADQPMVKVNCCALVETLLLSELFGHERGAFTGATHRKIGRFELAHRGTIFLDEIGDISPKTQVALLRVLQEQEFERVGGTSSVKVDVRIICATNRDLRQLVEEGSFREDLYFRLKGVTIDVPALRERSSDVPILAAHFLDRVAANSGSTKAKKINGDALALLTRYRWPGNVRELENVLRSVALFAESEVLQGCDFTEYPDITGVSQIPPGDGVEEIYHRLRSDKVSLRQLQKQVERICIQQALQETEGHVTRAAKLLGMTRSRLSQVIKELGLRDGVNAARRSA